MALPVGTLTRGQILDLALRRVGNTNVTVRTDAADWLNQILYDLFTQFTWPFSQTSTTVTLGSTFALPSDFLSTVDDAGLMVETYGTSTNRFVLPEKDRETFERLRSSLTLSGMPERWCADRTTGNGLVFPIPDQATSATLRYNRLPAVLTADSDVPTFPWHNWLVDAVYVRALEYEFDGRATDERLKLEASLSRIRQTAFPLKSQRPTIPLDPDIFTAPFNGDV